MVDVKGADKLVERFGSFPLFHDAEVLAINTLTGIAYRRCLHCLFLIIKIKIMSGAW